MGPRPLSGLALRPRLIQGRGVREGTMDCKVAFAFGLHCITQSLTDQNATCRGCPNSNAKTVDVIAEQEVEELMQAEACQKCSTAHVERAISGSELPTPQPSSQSSRGCCCPLLFFRRHGHMR